MIWVKLDTETANEMKRKKEERPGFFSGSNCCGTPIYDMNCCSGADNQRLDGTQSFVLTNTDERNI